MVFGVLDNLLVSLMKTCDFLQKSLAHVLLNLIHPIEFTSIHGLNSEPVEGWTETSSEMLEYLGVVKVQCLELHVEEQSLVFNVFLFLSQEPFILRVSVVLLKLNALL